MSFTLLHLTFLTVKQERFLFSGQFRQSTACKSSKNRDCPLLLKTYFSKGRSVFTNSYPYPGTQCKFHSGIPPVEKPRWFLRKPIKPLSWRPGKPTDWPLGHCKLRNVVLPPSLLLPPLQGQGSCRTNATSRSAPAQSVLALIYSRNTSHFKFQLVSRAEKDNISPWAVCPQLV